MRPLALVLLVLAPADAASTCHVEDAVTTCHVTTAAELEVAVADPLTHVVRLTVPEIALDRTLVLDHDVSIVGAPTRLVGPRNASIADLERRGLEIKLPGCVEGDDTRNPVVFSVEVGGHMCETCPYAYFENIPIGEFWGSMMERDAYDAWRAGNYTAYSYDVVNDAGEPVLLLDDGTEVTHVSFCTACTIYHTDASDERPDHLRIVDAKGARAARAACWDHSRLDDRRRLEALNAAVPRKSAKPASDRVERFRDKLLERGSRSRRRSRRLSEDVNCGAMPESCEACAEWLYCGSDACATNATCIGECASIPEDCPTTCDPFIPCMIAHSWDCYYDSLAPDPLFSLVAVALGSCDVTTQAVRDHLVTVGILDLSRTTDAEIYARFDEIIDPPDQTWVDARTGHDRVGGDAIVQLLEWETFPTQLSRNGLLCGSYFGDGSVVAVLRNATVELSGLTITGGSAVVGAGVCNDGSTTLDQVVIEESVAIPPQDHPEEEYRAAIAATAAFDTAMAGGVFNGHAGTMTIVDSEVRANGAWNFGGGVVNSGGRMHVSRSVISANAASYMGGLANLHQGELNVSDSTITENTALVDGGGLTNFAGTTRLVNATVIGNRAVRHAGGLFNEAPWIVELVDTAVVNNTAGEMAGGIYNHGGVLQPRLQFSFETLHFMQDHSPWCEAGTNTTDVEEYQLDVCSLEAPSIVCGGDPTKEPLPAGACELRSYDLNARLTLTRSTVQGNTAHDKGGGIFNVGLLDVSGDSKIFGNAVRNPLNAADDFARADDEATIGVAESVAEEVPPNGDPSCPCLPVVRPDEACDAAEWETFDENCNFHDGFVAIDSVIYQYGTDFGLGKCNPWELYKEPFCKNITADASAGIEEVLVLPSGATSWCYDSWCYVNSSNCAKEYKSTYVLENEVLHYSYQTCGFGDQFAVFMETRDPTDAGAQLYNYGGVNYLMAGPTGVNYLPTGYHAPGQTPHKCQEDLCTSFEFDTVTNSYQRKPCTTQRCNNHEERAGQWVVEGDRGNLEAEFPTPCDVSADVQQPKPDEYYCEPFDPRTGHGGVAALVPLGYYATGAPGARSSYKLCDDGAYCVDGQMHDCPAGTYTEYTDPWVKYREENPNASLPRDVPDYQRTIILERSSSMACIPCPAHSSSPVKSFGILSCACVAPFQPIELYNCLNCTREFEDDGGCSTVQRNQSIESHRPFNRPSNGCEHCREAAEAICTGGSYADDSTVGFDEGGLPVTSPEYTAARLHHLESGVDTCGCPKGTELSDGKCKTCAHGYFSGIVGLVPCDACPPHSLTRQQSQIEWTRNASNIDADHVDDCVCDTAKGFMATGDHYDNIIGSPTCECKPGTRPDDEEKTCVECDARTYNAGTSFLPCERCPSDRITQNFMTGADSHTLCVCNSNATGHNPNTVEDHTVPPVCEVDDPDHCYRRCVCMAGHEEVKGVCTKCAKGYRKDEIGAQRCTKCFEGVDCDSPGLDYTLADLPLKVGWWRLKNTSKKAYQCKSRGACKVGDTNASAKRNGIDGEGCAPSFHGPMCSVCKDGTSARLGVCEPCDDATQSRTVGVLVGGSVALVLLFFGAAMWFVRQARAEAGRRGLIETAITFYKDKYDEKAANESGSDDDDDDLAPEVPDPEPARPPAAPSSAISPALFTTRGNRRSSCDSSPHDLADLSRDPPHSRPRCQLGIGTRARVMRGTRAFAPLRRRRRRRSREPGRDSRVRPPKSRWRRRRRSRRPGRRRAARSSAPLRRRRRTSSSI